MRRVGALRHRQRPHHSQDSLESTAHELYTEYFDPIKHEPKVDSDYINYIDFERKKRLPTKTLRAKMRKFADKFRGNENLYEERLPKDEQGYSAVYGQFQGRGIHGPVNWDQFYGTYDRIGSRYNKKPGTRLQRTLPRLFGSSDKPLIKSEHKFLKLKGFSFEELLGRGAFGEVWLVKQRITERSEGKKTKFDRMIACKILSLKSFEKDYLVKDAVQQVTDEANIYSTLNHINIIKRIQIIHFFDEKSGFPHPIKVLLFMELMEGDLFSLIHNENDDEQFEYRQQECGWTENPDKFTHLWSKQIVSGLRYLHENNVTHMDIKPENILYSTHMESQNKKYIFKLTDFGLSFKFESNVPNIAQGEYGSPRYMAPEVASGSPFETKKSDIYSLGVVMADSIGSDSWDLDHIKDLIRNAESNQDCKQLKITRWLAILVRQMIEPDPNLRPDILQVYHHNWIKTFYPKQ